MAIALQQLNQTNPNLSTIELEKYVTATEQAYSNYLLEFSPESHSPPLPPRPYGCNPPSPINQSYIPSPINVIVNQGSYTDKEREVIPIKPDASLREFIAWQCSAKEALSLIEHFHEDILTRQRHEILFHSALSNIQIDALYKTVWTKLKIAIRPLNGKSTDIEDIESPHVSQLWTKLHAIFMPTTSKEKYRLDALFGALVQGNLSTRAYIQLIREKSNELRLIGMPVAKERLVSMLLHTLTDRILLTFVYGLSPSLTTDEYLNSILQYDKSITKDATSTHINIPTPTVLMVAQDDKSYRNQPHIKCYKCNRLGHKSYECPSSNGDHTEQSDISSPYNTAPSNTQAQHGQNPSMMHPDSNYQRDNRQTHHPRYSDHQHRNSNSRTSTPPPSDSNYTQEGLHNNYRHYHQESQRSPSRDSRGYPFDNTRGSSYSRDDRSVDRHNSPHSYYEPNHNQQPHVTHTSSSDRRGYSGQRRDHRDRSRDRYDSRTSRSRERSSSHHNRPYTPTKDSVSHMSQTQFRTLLTECLGALPSGASAQQQSTRLAIEGELDKHICDQVTHHTAAVTTPYHQSFMVEVVEVSDDSSDDDELTSSSHLIPVAQPEFTMVVPNETVASTEYVSSYSLMISLFL